MIQYQVITILYYTLSSLNIRSDKMKMMLPLLAARLPHLLFLAVGVVSALTTGPHGNVAAHRPIIAVSQQLRICADLCRSGLGGAPCGDVCYDLLPKQIPVQSPDENAGDGAGAATSTGGVTRNEACPVLCKNHLGYPFCQCETLTDTQPQTTKTTDIYTVDYNEICDHYCLEENWMLRGCPPCRNRLAQQEHFPSLFQQNGGAHLAQLVQIPGIAVQRDSRVDWGKWCNVQCANSNGGSACNCDILPFALQFN
ncbi:hypothetical protein CBL_20720 [Carabus blaptoides fortunei]